MSEIIRDAVIRLRLEQQKTKLEAPQAEKRAFQEQAKAVKEVEKSTTEASKSTAEYTRVTQEFGLQSVRHFREAGHGALQLARGIALMSASGEEDTRKMLENFVKIEAAVSILSGGAKLARFAAAFGPPGQAIAALLVAATAGVAVWQRYANEAEKAAKAVENLARAERERVAGSQLRFQRELSGINELDIASGARRIAAGLTPETRAKRIQEEYARQQASAGKAEADIEKLFAYSNRIGPITPKQLQEPAERSVRAAERGAELTRQDYEVQKELLEIQRGKMHDDVRKYALDPRDARSRDEAIDKSIDQKEEALARKFGSFLDRLNNVLDQKEERLRQIENGFLAR